MKDDKKWVFRVGCLWKKRSSLAELRLEIVEKASQSLPLKRQKIKIIFCQGVYLTENTYQAASVSFVRYKRTKNARSRLQYSVGKPRRGFSTAWGGALAPPVFCGKQWFLAPFRLFLHFSQISLSGVVFYVNSIKKFGISVFLDWFYGVFGLQW